MFNLPVQPETISFTLVEHAGLEDAPVFVCRPLTVAEGAVRSGEYMRCQAEYGSAAQVFIDIFDKQVLRVEGLQVGGDPFDKTNEKHREAIGYNAMIEIGGRIYYRNALTEYDAGK